MGDSPIINPMRSPAPRRYCCVVRRLTTRQDVYKRAMARRPLQDDEAFYSTYYGNTKIPKDIPLRLRRLFAYQLGCPWERLRPRDLIYRVDDDIDFAEIVFEAE